MYKSINFCKTYYIVDMGGNKMDFFDKLGKKASETYKATAEKTSKIAKEAKIKMKISENKSEINELYKKIGEKVYQKHVREENIDIKSELEEECTKIDVLAAEIESYLNETLELRDKKICQKCFAEIEKDVKFCPECGEKQPEAEETEAKEVEIVEKLENSEVSPENQTEKEIVEEELKEDIENKD